MFTLKRRYLLFSWYLEANEDFFTKKIFLHFYVPCYKNGQIVVECYRKIRDFGRSAVCLRRQQNVRGIRYGRSFRLRIIRFRDKTPRRVTGWSSLLYSFKKYNSRKDSFVVKKMCQGPRRLDRREQVVPMARGFRRRRDSATSLLHPPFENFILSRTVKSRRGASYKYHH